MLPTADTTSFQTRRPPTQNPRSSARPPGGQRRTRHNAAARSNLDGWIARSINPGDRSFVLSSHHSPPTKKKFPGDLTPSNKHPACRCHRRALLGSRQARTSLPRDPALGAVGRAGRRETTTGSPERVPTTFTCVRTRYPHIHEPMCRVRVHIRGGDLPSSQDVAPPRAGRVLTATVPRAPLLPRIRKQVRAWPRAQPVRPPAPEEAFAGRSSIIALFPSALSI